MKKYNTYNNKNESNIGSLFREQHNFNVVLIEIEKSTSSLTEKYFQALNDRLISSIIKQLFRLDLCAKYYVVQGKIFYCVQVCPITAYLI